MVLSVGSHLVVGEVEEASRSAHTPEIGGHRVQLGWGTSASQGPGHVEKAMGTSAVSGTFYGMLATLTCDVRETSGAFSEFTS